MHIKVIMFLKVWSLEADIFQIGRPISNFSNYREMSENETNPQTLSRGRLARSNLLDVFLPAIYHC